MYKVELTPCKSALSRSAPCELAPTMMTYCKLPPAVREKPRQGVPLEKPLRIHCRGLVSFLKHSHIDCCDMLLLDIIYGTDISEKVDSITFAALFLVYDFSTPSE